MEELVVCIVRCLFYLSWGNWKYVLEEVEKVIVVVNFVEYLDVWEFVCFVFVYCLCFYVVDCYKDGNVIELKRLMGLVKSKILRCNNVLEFVEVEFLEVCMLCYEG